MRRLMLLTLLALGLLGAAGQYPQYLPAGPGRDPVPEHPLLRGLLTWLVVRPPLIGGPTWWATVGPYHGTLTNMGNGFGWQASVRPDSWGELRLDGTAAYVTLGTSSAFDFLDTTFTVAGKARCTNAGNTNYLVTKRTSVGSVGAGGWFLRIDGGGTLTARLITDSNAIAAQRTSTTAILCNGTWFSFAGLFITNTTVTANNDLAIYINGVLDQGGPAAQTAPFGGCPTCRTMLGTTEDLAGPLGGALDDVRIYTRLLTPQEVWCLHWGQGATCGSEIESPALYGALLTTPTKRRVVIE